MAISKYKQEKVQHTYDYSIAKQIKTHLHESNCRIIDPRYVGTATKHTGTLKGNGARQVHHLHAGQQQNFRRDETAKGVLLAGKCGHAGEQP
ncbi:expressed unknown protein [Seminavis robusta]|uniref:Uncharacterized protein n=1 Tax=Seminavis robusta TaxID=568900 RepID=A0A9N8E1W0_9STRA|nr:expressed unknown protein [Seminavis robusta]|eukprot:Sro564_g167290.1 n/a (92) ;mRNA; r:14346-14702